MQRSFTFALLLVVCFVLLVGPVTAQDAPTPAPGQVGYERRDATDGG